MALILSPRAPAGGLLYPSRLLELLELLEVLEYTLLLLRSCTHTHIQDQHTTQQDPTRTGTRTRRSLLTELSEPRPGLSL